MKKIIAIFLACLMLCGNFSVINVSAAPTHTYITNLVNETEYTAGGKIQIGTYGGAPVEYTVWGKKDADGDGVEEIFLASSNVISYKEMHSSTASGDPYNAMSWKQDAKGEMTALRRWLNSADGEGQVPYGDAVNVSYKSQAGFLSTLEDYELGAIAKAKIASRWRNDSLNTDNPNPPATKGNFLIQQGHTWPEVLEGKNKGNDNPPHSTLFGAIYENGSYVITEDSIFIPSIQEILDFAGNTQTNANAFMNVSATQYAADNEGATGAPAGLNFDTNKLLYLRDQVFYNTTTTSKFANWVYASSKGSVSVNMTDQSSKAGIRPCMYLEPDTIVELVPDGTNVYRIKPPFVKELTYTQGGAALGESISTNAVNISGKYTTVNENAKVTAVLFRVEGGKEIMEDYKRVPEGSSLDITLTPKATTGNRYIAVYAVDSSGKMITVPEIKGTASTVAAFSATDAAAFALNEPEISGFDVTITGNAASTANDLTVLINRRDGYDAVVYANQFAVGDNKAFSIPITLENLVGTNTPENIEGRYNIIITSGGATVTKPIAIAGPAIWTGVLIRINAIDKTDNDYSTQLADLVKIFRNDESMDLEHTSITDKGFYYELCTSNAVAEAAIGAMIDARPAGGYTTSTVTTAFNAKILSDTFGAADTDGKYTLIEAEAYRSDFGSAELVSDTNYLALKASADKSKLFDGTTTANFSSKSYENMICWLLNKEEDYAKVKTIIEQYATKIGITFGSNYSSLSSGEEKTLYDAFLTGTIASYAEMQSIYTNTLNAIISGRDSGNSYSGGSSYSGGGGVSVVGGSVNNAPSPEITQPASFPDIENLTWGKEEIEYLAKKGIFSGDDKGNMNPDNNITREQFAKIAALAFDIEEISGAEFSDVDANAWYAGYVSALAEKGVLLGSPDGTYGVGSDITRQDVAVVICRLLGKDGEVSDGEKFADDDQIAEYARDAVMILADMGILQGNGDNTVNPTSPITRREAAMIIFRLIGGTK